MVTGERRYQVVSLVGRGGFGCVYRARMTGEGGFATDVALKVLNPDAERSEEIARRQRDEARLLGLVRHRAIVRVYALSRIRDRWTVVMEYVDGAALHTLLREGPIPVGPALEIAGEVADALHVAYHTDGPDGQPLRLVHRDVKPSNVRITASGEIKLLDFGIARAEFAGREAETRSILLGTPEYMAPERHDEIEGPPGDVYSLGLMLSVLLTRSPARRTSANEARHGQYRDEVLDRLDAALDPRSAVRADVVALVGETLSFDPSTRPDARAFERRCADLRARAEGPRLRDWAEATVPTVRGESALPQEDDLAGTTLVERGSNLAMELPPAPPHPAGPVTGTGATARAGALGLAAGMGLAVVAGVVVLALAAAGWLLLGREPARTSPEAAPEDAPPPLDEGTATSPSEVPAASKPAPPASNPRAPEPTVARAPDAAESGKAEPAKRSGARVRFEGDATDAWLVRGGHRYASGEVPAGTYAIVAVFPRRGEVAAGTVELAPGRTTTVLCTEAFVRCAPRP